MSRRLTIQVLSINGKLLCSESFTGKTIAVGRANSNDLILPFAEISREQLKIEWDQNEETILIQNLSESNRAFQDAQSFESLKVKESEETRFVISGYEFRVLSSLAKLEKTRIIHPDEYKSSPWDFFSDISKAWVPATVLLAIGILLFLYDNSRVTGEALLVKESQASIFEVVTTKKVDDAIVYEKKLPLENLDFKERNDRYKSIGTAFYIGDGVFVSAEHVLALDRLNADKDFFLRDAEGEVHEVHQILSLSNHKDLVSFDLKKLPENLEALELHTETEVGETVYTAGNALGQGFSVRNGVLSSYTPEPYDGSWNYIRFSAPASPGNSGGPLLNSEGQVIGVVVMKSSGENLNYAVPIEELSKLKNDEAEFRYKGIAEIEFGLHLDAGQWSLTQKLPDKPSDLKRKASLSFKEKVIQNRENFDQKYKDNIYPHDPSIKALLIESSLGSNRGFTLLDRDKTGKWGLRRQQGTLRDLKEQGLFWFDLSRQSNALQTEFVFYFPKDKTAQDFWPNGKKIFDLALKETGWNRRFAGEKILIESYGEAHESDEWRDNLDRSWRTWVWRSSFDSRSHVVSCMPYPKSIACQWSYAEQSFEALVRFYNRLQADRLLRPYYAGNKKQWKDFLSLDAKWIPPVISELKIEISDQKNKRALASIGSSFQLEIGDDPQEELAIATFWNATNPQKLEVVEIVHKGRLGEEAFTESTSLYHKATKGVSESYKETWKKITENKHPYSGKRHKKGGGYDWRFPLTNSGKSQQESRWVKSCRLNGTAKKSTRDRFFKKCQSNERLWNL